MKRLVTNPVVDMTDVSGSSGRQCDLDDEVEGKIEPPINKNFNYLFCNTGDKRRPSGLGLLSFAEGSFLDT